MPTIRVENDVFEGLQRLAQPFVDSPSSVIRRLLEEKGVLAAGDARRPRAPASASPRAALTPQSTYEQYLLYVLEREFKGKGHKRDATTAVIRKMMADGFIGAAEQEMVATGETRAENTITWGRNALKDRGYISKLSARGTWELTPEGRAAAKAITLPRTKAV
jgi:hypothetical protein